MKYLRNDLYTHLGKLISHAKQIPGKGFSDSQKMPFDNPPTERSIEQSGIDTSSVEGQIALTRRKIKRIYEENPFKYSPRIQIQYRIVVESHEAEVLFISFLSLKNIIDNYPVLRLQFEGFFQSSQTRPFRILPSGKENTIGKASEIPLIQQHNLKNLEHLDAKELLEHFKKNYKEIAPQRSIDSSDNQKLSPGSPNAYNQGKTA